MCSTGSSFENRRSRIIASSTWLGVGLQPPLFRLIIVRSESNARWISAQYDSSSAMAEGGRSPAMTLARKSDLIALSRKIGCAEMPAAASPDRNSRLVVIGSPQLGPVPFRCSIIRMRGTASEFATDTGCREAWG